MSSSAAVSSASVMVQPSSSVEKVQPSTSVENAQASTSEKVQYTSVIVKPSTSSMEIQSSIRHLPPPRTPDVRFGDDMNVDDDIYGVDLPIHLSEDFKWFDSADGDDISGIIEDIIRDDAANDDSRVVNNVMYGGGVAAYEDISDDDIGAGDGGLDIAALKNVS